MKIIRNVTLILFAAFVSLISVPRLSAEASHLPLEVGNRWELMSGGQRMSLEVTGRRGDAYLVKWDNPYVSGVEFQFTVSGNKILLEALNMGGGFNKMPSETVYFDFDLPQGKSWSNNLGTSTVLSKGKNVSTPSGTYNNCIEIRLHAKDGAQTFWTFAPNVGFVQFGQGKGAFLLSSRGRGREDNVRGRDERDRDNRDRDNRDGGRDRDDSRNRRAPTASAPSNASGLKPSGSVLIGLDALPTPKEGYTDNSKKNRFRMAKDTGVNYVYLHPKWTEVEPNAGKYKWDELDLYGGLANEHNLPVSVNLRIIDTNQRAINDSYKNWHWNDPRMADKLKNILHAMAPHIKGRVKWFAIGNEVDAYFQNHKGEIGEYVQLINAVLPTVHELFPEAGFTINFTHFALGDINKLYAPMTNLVDFYSWTYYPFTGDFTFQNPDTAGPDIQRLVEAAGGKLVLFQELGYASGSAVNSSEDKQAQFLENVFEALRAHQNRIIAGNFVWMSDLPQSTVDDLTRYYSGGNAVKMKAFLGTLGYWRTDGQPKKAWAVFQREASRM